MPNRNYFAARKPCRSRNAYFRAALLPATLGMQRSLRRQMLRRPAISSRMHVFAAAPAFAALRAGFRLRGFRLLCAPLPAFFGVSFFFGGSLIPDNFRKIFSRSSGVFPRPVN